MNKYLILVVASLFILIIVYQTTQDTNLKQKQIHNFKNNHKREIGYSNDNEECRNKCQQANGINCGKNWQNCCIPDKCDIGWITEICDKRIRVIGCTDE
ncbi:unnamed protein product [Paramecium pentaurelia]|uniref:Uncharacterized protein n=1 Tax=Paramecium pentaurelia TaxID=43138 RepID=A0A8S1U8T8_9CILI|nr:unnamed protein product [Paramecium pentaurelia]